MKALLIEDDLNVSSFIKRGLEERGILVTQSFDGETGVKMVGNDEFDVIILDIIMPGINGIEVCRKLRTDLMLKTPILMLTALGTTDDIVEGFEAGADDYLCKPFKFNELVARLNALTRRSGLSLRKDFDKLKVKDLEMNLLSKEVFRGDVEIQLTAREFKLLEHLLRNKNRVLSRSNILENVWEVGFDMGTNVIEVYINYLRKKIDQDFPNKLIRTVVGMGYVIKDR